MFINNKSFTTNLSVILTVIMPLSLALPLLYSTAATAKPHSHQEKEYKQNRGRGNNPHNYSPVINPNVNNNYPVNYPGNYPGNHPGNSPKNNSRVVNPVNPSINNYPGNYPGNYPTNNSPVVNPVNPNINNYPGNYPSNNSPVNTSVNYPNNNYPVNYPNNNYPVNYPTNNYPRTANNYAKIPAGTVIPVTYEKAEKIVITPEESMELELTVTQNIISGPNSLIIPAGSKITGELQPTDNGTEFVANTIILTNGQKLPISAFSQEVTRTKNIEKGADAGDIGKGAVIGAAAATALSAILGDQAIATEEVLGGLGIGAIAGVLLGREKVEVIVIYPQEDLALTLANDFFL